MNHSCLNLFFVLQISFFVIGATFSFADPSYGMEPGEVLVVANSRMSGSVDLAEYYMQKRNIPESHLLSLSLSLKETMSREEYNRKLKEPVLKAIDELTAKVRIAAIVLIYGVPLKVDPESIDWDVKEQIKILRENLNSGKKEVSKKEILSKIELLTKKKQRAAVDSELALVKAGDYPLAGWVRNPYFVGFNGQTLPINKGKVLLVTRLDGPDEKTVYRIIDDTLFAEKNGLKGKAYFDARWKMIEKSDLSGYRLYDVSLHKSAKIVSRRMEVILDERPQLFAKNSCPEAALYSGWYSLSNYIDSFQWQRGAIGYHLASGECATLRNTSSRGWCLKMLENGVAATIGPVYEPYIQGVPLPEIFFSNLIDGYMSLGESYLVSIPFFSWQVILVGDPLYQPFSPMPARVKPDGGRKE